MAGATIFPPGMIMMFGSASGPSGWLLCDGTSYATATYPSLFGAIGYAFGGSGANFNVPNLLGYFPRGANSGAGVGPSTIVGATTLDQMQGHYHAPEPTLRDGYGRAVSGGGTGIPSGVGAGEPANAAGPPSSDGTNGTPRTGLETRPAFVAVALFIKV